jgi:hypothetical protein
MDYNGKAPPNWVVPGLSPNRQLLIGKQSRGGRSSPYPVAEFSPAKGLELLYRELAAWLLPTALATDYGPTLVATLIEELRTRRIVCSPLPAIERLAGSRFPNKERLCMPGSKTTQDRTGTRKIAPVRVAFRHANGVGTLN